MPIPGFNTAFKDLVITGDTIRLRRLQEKDAKGLARYANNPKIAANLMDRFPEPYTEAKAKAFIVYAQDAETESVFGIELNGEVIGVISLLFKPDIYAVSAELGYWIGEPYWGKGIIKEALRLIVKHAFKDLKHSRVFANVFHTNAASQKALEKTGFVLEGVAHKAAFKKGVLLNVWTYGAINPDFV
ncbi:MAG: GNAT family N-acetyltransferase [Mameliella sp.]|nr:GNAT family N-acetyltransferase [Phaeodactylibacter sp.]